MLVSLPLPGTRGHRSRVWNGGRVNIPWPAIASIAPLMFDSYFAFSITTFFFATLSSLLASFLFQVLILVGCHVDLSLGDKEAIQGHILLSVWELNKRCTVTSHRQTLEEDMTGH